MGAASEALSALLAGHGGSSAFLRCGGSGRLLMNKRCVWALREDASVGAWQIDVLNGELSRLGAPETTDQAMQEAVAGASARRSGSAR